MTGKVKVTFLETRVVKDGFEGTDRETKFEAGKTYPLEPESAERWIKRKVAEPAKPTRRKTKPPQSDEGAGGGNEAGGDGGNDDDTGGDGDTGGEDGGEVDLLSGADKQE